MQNPSPAHQAEATRALAYMTGTKTYAIEFGPPTDAESPVFFGASDAAFADDPITRRSAEGYIFKMFG